MSDHIFRKHLIHRKDSKTPSKALLLEPTHIKQKPLKPTVGPRFSLCPLNFLTFITFFAMPLLVSAQVNGAGSTSLNFEKLGMGARAVGMGEAFTAVADDATAMFWNPAGLVLARGTQLSFTHGEWIQGVTDEYFAFSQNLWRSGSFGASAQFLNSGSFAGALEGPGGTYGGVGPNISYSSVAGSLAYAQRLGYWIPGGFFENSLLGVKVSLLGENLSTLNSSAFTFDIGYMHEIIHRTLYLGTVLSNVGADVLAYSEPLNYNLAGSLRLHDSLVKRDQNILAMESVGYLDTGLGFKVGDEYRVNFDDNGAALRMGFRVGNELDSVTNLTAGVGLYHQFSDVEVSLDYAFVPYSILGNTHRVTINIVEGANVVPLKIALDPSPSFILGQGNMDAPVSVSGAPINHFKFTVLNPLGAPVRTVSGNGTPPAHFIWDGKNEKGELVPKGKYTVQMEATDEDDQTSKTPPRPVNARWVSRKIPYQHTYQIQGDLLFKSGRAELWQKGYETIKSAMKDIQAKYPDCKVQIAGHTDNVKVMPGKKYKDNQELSLERAKSVMDFLVKNGVKESQLSVIGYGDTKPIAPNDTWGGKKKNRRVELVVTGASEVTAEDLIEEGQKTIAQKKYKDALPILQKALESDERNPLIYQLIGNCYWLMGDKDNAMENIQKALQYDPDNQSLKDWVKIHVPNPAEELIGESKKVMAQGNYKDALTLLSKALESDDHNPMIYQLIGNCHWQLGDRDQAVLDIQTALQYDPNNQSLKNWVTAHTRPPAEAFIAEGKKAMAQGDYKGALPSLMKALETDGRNPRLYQLIGNCRWQMGDKAGAIQDLQNALQYDPNNQPLRDWIKAHSAQPAAPVKPTVSAAQLIASGKKTMAQGDYKGAVPAFLTALESDPRNALVYQLLGVCHWQMGDKNQAIQDSLKSLEINPNNQPLKD